MIPFGYTPAILAPSMTPRAAISRSITAASVSDDSAFSPIYLTHHVSKDTFFQILPAIMETALSKQQQQQ
jgi:hypothetical protein